MSIIKNVLLLAFIINLFIAVSPAKAQTTDEILLQIQNLLQQIEILQVQLQTLQSQPPVIKPSEPGPPIATPPVSSQGVCPALNRTLKKGSTGTDVTQLQTYLAKDSSIYPEGLVTGYFGTLTEKAVQRWQAKEGIVSSGTPSTSGYGLVGPRTRSALNQTCNLIYPVQSSVPEQNTIIPQPLSEHLVTIHSVSLRGRVFAINGSRINYTVNFKNNTQDTISNVYTEVSIKQGTTRKRASSRSVVCAPNIELKRLPPGFCGDTGSFHVSNAEEGTGTLVNGAAEVLIQITSDDKVLAEKSIPITLIDGIGSAPAQIQESVSDDETVYLGTGKTAILLVKFPDINDPIPFDKSYMDNMVFGANGDSLNDYMEEVSYGKYKLTGKTIDWLTMPNDFDHYCVLKPGYPNNYHCRLYAGMGVDAPGIIVNDAVKVADAFMDFSLIDRIIIVTNTGVLNCSTRATAWSLHDIPTNEGMIAPSIIFTNREDMLVGKEAAGSPLDILIHEFGHNLGLKHAAGWQCGNKIVGENLDDLNSGECNIDGYQDNSDVMGSKNRHHFSAVNKEIAGLIKQNQILTISSDGTYIIDQLELPSSGYKEIKIPLGGGNYYTLEYRRPVGYDSSYTDGKLTDGVFLRLQIAPVTDRQYGFSTVRPYEPEPLIINPNKSFVDGVRGIKVEVIEKNSNQAKVRISGTSNDIALRPQKLIALGNADDFFLGDTLKIVKGQKDTKLFRSNVFNSDRNSPLTIKNMRVVCIRCNGVLDNISLYRNDILIKTISTPVYNEKLDYLVYDFTLESSNIVIPPYEREIYTFKGDISTSDFNVYSVPNTFVELQIIEGEINGYPVTNTFMSFSRPFEL